MIKTVSQAKATVRRLEGASTVTDQMRCEATRIRGALQDVDQYHRWMALIDHYDRIGDCNMADQERRNLENWLDTRISPLAAELLRLT